MKRCRQCGRELPVGDFRLYYNGSGKTYNQCLDCERINSRYKYLKHKHVLSVKEQEEMTSIIGIYDKAKKCGLQVPQCRRNTVALSVQVIEEAIPTELSVDIPDSAPYHLTRWLTEDLTKVSDLAYLEDTLVKRYRPIIGLDPNNMPIYNNLFKDILATIGNRIDAEEERRESNDTKSC